MDTNAAVPPLIHTVDAREGSLSTSTNLYKLVPRANPAPPHPLHPASDLPKSYKDLVNDLTELKEGTSIKKIKPFQFMIRRSMRSRWIAQSLGKALRSSLRSLGRYSG
ncbi:hypothetical protein C0991_012538 [Blastosporella zonata]|nr:hypothetical protein C0991_012538 [Blastosporella zonata]